MKQILLVFYILKIFPLIGQPVLVNSNPYSLVSTIVYDSLTDKIFYNVTNGCPSWNIPCAYSYSVFGMHNIINKHSFSDNNVATVQASKHQVQTPSYPLNNYNSAFSRQSLKNGNAIYTNFGYYFSKIDTSLSAGPLWTYSPTVNASLKEISTFEICGDSVFLFQKDSTSGKNYYSLIVKNKLTGSDIAYNSLSENSPLSSNGSIEGHIHNSVRVNNTIILTGAFTASVSGNFISRNIVSLNVQTGQLMNNAPSLVFGTTIYDMKLISNKIIIVGRFTTVNGVSRRNYAEFDLSLNLLPGTIHFDGSGPQAGIWLDKIELYENYLLAKGNFSMINGTITSSGNTYSVKAIDLITGQIQPWTINLPGTPLISDYTFNLIKNKLYVKNRNSLGSPFYIYCFPPLNSSQGIIHVVNSQTVSTNPATICSPDTSGVHLFLAPITNANTFSWMYSGTNATIVPIGNGDQAKLITSSNSSNGVLSVTGMNDCGLTSGSSTIAIVIQQKPSFTPPASPQVIICNPDSTLIQGVSSNTSALISWRKQFTAALHPQPYYAKTPGNYFMIVNEPISGCSDSSFIIVNENKAKPNTKVISHVYPGVSTPIDTVTCFSPSVSITAGSDSLGVTLTWKSISTNSVTVNPLITSSQNNFKIISTRNSNNCVDSSMIVLIGQNTSSPTLSFGQYNNQLNCSTYSTSVSAIYPNDCSVIWSGPGISATTNTIVVNNAGTFTAEVQNNLNGCISSDSVKIVATNSIILNVSNDTIVCKQSPVTLQASSVGTLTSVVYNWSNGFTGSSNLITPLFTSFYVVEANGPGPCYGKDSIEIKVPPIIQDSTLTYKGCNNDSTGKIVVFAKGGLPPYKYSMNNGVSFSENNVFTDIPYNIYQMAIKDSLNCIRNFTIQLQSTNQLPDPEFLVSTLNYKNDTLVLVNITVPPADSVAWDLPQGINLIGGNNGNKIITASDTGLFLITLRSFFGTCTITTTKYVQFKKSDSLIATNLNNNGIKTFSLYPNPSNGQFTIHVEFFKKQNVSLQVWSTSMNQHLQLNYYDSDDIDLPVNLQHLQNGSYIFRVIGEYDSRSKTFLIDK